MDWTTLITSIATLLLGGGGLVAFLTVNDKKYQAMVESVEKTNEQWQHIAEERTHRAEELKAELDKKDDKIDELYKDISTYRATMDNQSTELAVKDGQIKLLEYDKCKIRACPIRKPPRDEEVDYTEFIVALKEFSQKSSQISILENKKT